jgi:hypothetical protein
MVLERRAGPRWRLAAVLGIAALAAGCGTLGGGEEQVPLGGLSCVDDSPHCVAQRSNTLRAMMADPARRWVREPSSASSHASGVRLFAFKQRKRDLSCEELTIGLREAESAPGVLRGPGGAGLTPAQVSRGAMFAEEVARELANERRRRCRV